MEGEVAVGAQQLDVWSPSVGNDVSDEGVLSVPGRPFFFPVAIGVVKHQDNGIRVSTGFARSSIGVDCFNFIRPFPKGFSRIFSFISLAYSALIAPSLTAFRTYGGGLPAVDTERVVGSSGPNDFRLFDLMGFPFCFSFANNLSAVVTITHSSSWSFGGGRSTLRTEAVFPPFLFEIRHILASVARVFSGQCSLLSWYPLYQKWITR